MKRLEGKVALVTGGAQGIGKIICERFASQGADIAVCDMNKELSDTVAESLSVHSVKAESFLMNVSDEDSVAEAIKKVLEDFGRIDILVNNAGITRDNLMMRMKKQDWDAVISVNLTGTYIVSKAVVRHMMKARTGSIINISSVVGVTGNAGQANYSASKAGVIGLTKTMAREFASRNVTVNALAPGYIITEMTGILSDEAKSAFMEKIPLKREGTPEDVARAAEFFASDDAKYITGQVLCVDGGMVM
ncbi:3-oxoacyl-[acyl-carrier-protein] reductase [Candidatus Latescibacterota bacterium]